MAALKFPEFVKRHQLQLLGVSTTDVIPGAVLDKGKRGFLYQGHLREVLPEQPGSFWELEINEANIVYGSVERDFSLQGRSSLDEMGISVEGGLGAAKFATFTITGVHARTFVNGPGHATKFAIIPLVQTLRSEDRTRWRMVNGKWLVFETYYASEVTVTFNAAGNVNLQADVKAAGGASVQGSGGLTWKSKRSFVVTGNDLVPFAFRGWQV